MTRYGSGYFLKHGKSFEEFWTTYLKRADRKILFILGLTFDPRSLQCLKIIADVGDADLACRVLLYGDRHGGAHMLRALEKNKTEFGLVEKRESREIRIPMHGDEQVQSLRAVMSMREEDLEIYSDIIVDVTAMPNGVYFPMIREIMKKIRAGVRKPNLHVTVSENPALDAAICEPSHHEKPTLLYGFDKSLQQASLSDLRHVWLTILGENRSAQLDKLCAYKEFAETVPVFPMPSSDPYRSTNLLLEYSTFLLDTQAVEPRNFLYSDEKNPFETCEKICQTAEYYYDVLAPLGGCHVVLSTVSSKLLSVGCMLAACELLDQKRNLGVIHMVNQSQHVEEAVLESPGPSTPFTMWVMGECYG